MRPRLLTFALVSSALSAFGFSNAGAQNSAAQFTVQLTATARSNPPQVTLTWPHEQHEQAYTVYRRDLGVTGNWGTATKLKATDTSYLDGTVVRGRSYEYRVVETGKSDSTYYVSGFIAAGVDMTIPGDRGKVILLVDNTYANDLSAELTRLTSDLQAEGWGVIRHDVSRTAAVTDIKDTLINDYGDGSSNVNTLFIFGHVPVPYSGLIAPDGHYPGSGNHYGAWPADMYYGQLDGDWTDEFEFDTTAFRLENRNVPGDGKFDQDGLPSGSQMQLMVGRVDFANMPAFTKSEKELLKLYLDKDHAFRTGSMIVPKRALVDINFGVFTGYDVPGEDAWRNLPPLVGRDHIDDFHALSAAGDWFNVIDTAEYLWAYGCGAGYFNSCSGVGTTQQYAASGAKGVFNMLFGSFFGDWDAENDLTRAAIATDYGLTSCWVSRPFWYMHPLGAGQTFGYCTMITQDATGTISYDATKHIVFNSDYVTGIAMQGIHVALMGDPTLRMEYPTTPPTALSAVVNGNTVNLNWERPSNGNVEAWNIYRASSLNGPYTLLTSTPVTAVSFQDPSPLNGQNVYAVHAVVSESTPSGSLANESAAAMQTISIQKSGVAAATAVPVLATSDDGKSVDLRLSLESTNATRVSVIDVAGREIEVLANSTLAPGSYSFRIDKSTLESKGIYFIRVVAGDRITTAKFIN